MPNTAATIIQASRPKFVVLAPICVLLGFAAADFNGFPLDMALVVCCLLVATLGHISVNLLNEYHDAKSGLDACTQKTPFSGGSGALQAHPGALKSVLVAGLCSLFLLTTLGLYVAFQVELWLSILGLVGIAVILAYTPWLNQHAWLCLFAPGFAFGILMIVGAYAVFAHGIDSFVLLLSLPVFCLVNNLLLLNQFPDALADQEVGRNHFVIRFGYQRAAWAYLVFLIFNYVCVLALVLFENLPTWSLISMIGLPIGLLIFVNAKRFDPEYQQQLLPYMGANVMLTLAVPLIFAITLFFH